MTYVSRHTRLLIPKWLEEGDEGYIYALRRKRSDQKLKFQNSCEDLRAWVDDECLRTQHFVESMSHKEFLGRAPFGIFGRFIPITFLADSLCQNGKKKKDSIQEIFPVQESKKKKKKSVEKPPVDVQSLENQKSDFEPIEVKPIKSEPVPAKPLEESKPTEVEEPVQDEVISLEAEKSDTEPSEDSLPSPISEEIQAASEIAYQNPEPEPEPEPECYKKDSFTSKQEDTLLCLNLLCKYSTLLRLAVNKLDEIDCAVNIPHDPCICDETQFENGISFEEFFTNCAKAMTEDSENSDVKPDSCCHCCSEENTDEILPPTPDPSICPSVSGEDLQYLSSKEKPGRIEEDLLRRISIFQQRLNQIEEHWKDLNDEIKNSQEKIKEYRGCQELDKGKSDKVKEIEGKLQELIIERIRISSQKCKVLKDLKNLKLTACARFTQSDLAVADKADNHFGKFPSCQCGFEDYSTSQETSSSERKSRVSFSPIVRDSNNKYDSISQFSYKVRNDGLSGRKVKSETNLVAFEKTLKHYERRIGAYECLDREVEMIKQKAMQTDYYLEELKKRSECREQIERECQEDKAKLCSEIERLKCIVNHLEIKLEETSQQVDYWQQGKDQEIAELEKETKSLKKKLCRSEGDYKEEKKYTNKLEELINLQRSEIERLMLQIQKMSKFITADKKTEMTSSTRVRSKSYSPDVKKRVQISDSKKIIKFTTSSDEKQVDCCCPREDKNSRQRITREMTPRAAVEYQKYNKNAFKITEKHEKYVKNYSTPRSQKC